MPIGTTAAILASLAAGVGGSVAGGLAGSGKQGRTTQDTTSNTSGTTDQTGGYGGLRQPLEPDYWTQFRQGLLPQYAQEMQRVQQPVFDTAKKSSFMQSLNDLTQNAMASMSGQFARRGLPNSGAEASGIERLFGQRLGKASDFFAGLPFQEEQMRRTGVGGLLGQGMSWAGGAPIGEAISGTSQQTGKTTQTGQTSGTSQEYGPSWWQGMLGNLGLLGTGYAANKFKIPGFKFGYSQGRNQGSGE